eukprot:CAMPEP_0180302776 /NCGR_PEP_ID=MMETSP0988-20121125/24526_1 /TAXON_ID=697907 /ORGANISM="non described non described, Strain CCMP2293" /LENGTH=45 /DNA_ID= /DNA_START= /DNA_END= /DNA_ORIENTATION=
MGHAARASGVAFPGVGCPPTKSPSYSTCPSDDSKLPKPQGSPSLN